ncbi:hypothetical protein [Roseimaritima ulvae]|uniref:Uncharacterized protein n=1 Tax=Roseimaritima ulvae TaxID=980254 RepID=A0A5B9QZP7_9BACT|nr:hypothetical protein [Roseimaritima ulvae]QEG42905.1 hypothetical protein UC8_49470 [Roseimaritima ulvae]
MPLFSPQARNHTDLLAVVALGMIRDVLAKTPAILSSIHKP